MQVPFQKYDIAHISQYKGDLAGYVYDWSKQGYEWRENYEFNATLELRSIERRGHKCGAYFTDETGTRFYMFLSELEKVIKQSGVSRPGARVTGRWTFCKRGERYSIKLVQERAADATTAINGEG
jgi:hypothetical protein